MSRATQKPLVHQVVRASAGAGKTYQLTTRYLDLLARHESAQHVLATTFTRKAAGEVLARVLGRLALACRDQGQRRALSQALDKPGLSRGQCVAMLRSLTDGLNRLAVGTIDGFFNRAARAMALDLDLPVEPRLIDEGSPLAQQMRFDAIHAVLGEQADNDDGMATLIEMLRRLHHDTAQRSVTEAIDHIVKDLSEVYRSYPDAALWDALPTTGLLSDDLLTAAVEGLVSMHAELPVTGKGSVYAGFQRKYEELITDAQARAWDRVLGNGLVKKVGEQADKYASAPISEAWHRAIRPFYVHAKSVRLNELAQQTRATHDLLALFNRQYEAMRRAQRVMLFSDLTHVLAEGLPGLGDAGIEELCYRLDAKVTHLLLDEFQDTSLAQWAVLEPFAQQIAATSDGSRSLFCVGDTKQAIYGWRGGCAELFDEVEALPGVEPETLSDSWRSSQVVLDAVNVVFGGLDDNAALAECRPAAVAWQKGFETHRAVQDSLPGQVVLQTTASDASPQRVASDEDDDEADAPPDAHAHYVAGYIQALTEAHPGRSIGVLMRSRAKARSLMHAMRSLGVYAAEEGGNPIGHTPAVAAVLSAIQLADHPGDSVSVFHVMNSPLAQVLELDASTDRDALARRLRRSLMDEGYAAVIAQWAERLASSCDAKSLRRLMQLIELAEDFDANDATLRPGFFVQAVRAAKVEDPSPALVRVMTIHASKGLEFDAVVLPDLDATLSSQDSRDLVVLDRASPIEPVRGVFRRVHSDFVSLTPQLEHAHAQHAYEKRTEDLCLLYVAITRARQGLHLLVRPLKQSIRKGSPTGKPTATGLTNLSYAAILRQALRGVVGEGFEGDECLYASGDAAWAESLTTSPAPPTPPTAPKSIKLVHRDSDSTRSWAKTTPSEMHDSATVSARDLLRVDSTGGQRFGTLMHALFEQVGFLDGDPPDDEALQAVLRSMPTGDIDPGQTLAAFKASLQQPAITALLQRDGADTLWRERRFVTRLDHRLVEGCLDRVHLWHESGRPMRALLIDFKTDRVDDSTLQAKVAGYADQIGLYRAALSSMLGLEASRIQARLCFVGDGRVVDV